MVTVTAAEDIDTLTETETLTHTATGGDYNTVVAAVTVTLTDNDAALVFTPTTLTVMEGSSAPYGVSLVSEPTAVVTVTIDGHSGTDLSLEPLSLTFTTDNWNVAQPVTVTAAEDLDAADDDETLTHTASGGNYSTVTGELMVTITDSDSAGVRLSETTTTVVEGESTRYTMRLNTQPQGTVTITVTATGAVSADTDAGTDGNQDTVTFTTGNWNVAQAVTVTGADDALASGDRQGTLTHAISTGDAGSYPTDLMIGSVVVTVTDDDRRGLTLTPDRLTIEEGGTASYTVALTSEPTAAVTVAIGDAGLSPTPTDLTFNMTNWNLAQPVMVTAGTDSSALQVNLTHTVDRRRLQLR